MIKFTLIFLVVFVTVNCEPPARYKGTERRVVGVKTYEGQNGSPGHSGYSVAEAYPGQSFSSGGRRGKNVGIFENFKRSVLHGMENGIFGRGHRPIGKTIVYGVRTHSFVPVPPPQNMNMATEQNTGDSDSAGGYSEHSVVEISPDNGVVVSPGYSTVGSLTSPVGNVLAGIYPEIVKNLQKYILHGMQNGIFGPSGVEDPGRIILVSPRTNATENVKMTEQVGGHNEYSAIGIFNSQIGDNPATGISPGNVRYNIDGVRPSYVRNRSPIGVSPHYSPGIRRPLRNGERFFVDLERGMEKEIFGGGGAERVRIIIKNKPYSMESVPEKSNGIGDSVGVHSEYSTVGASPSYDADIPHVGYPTSYNTVGDSPNHAHYSAIGHTSGYGKSIFENFKRGVLRGMENGIMGLGSIKSQSPYTTGENFNAIIEEGSPGENGYRVVSPGYSHGNWYAGGFGKNFQEHFKSGVLPRTGKGLFGALRPRSPLQQRYKPPPPRELPMPLELYDKSPWIPMKSEKGQKKNETVPTRSTVRSITS